MLDKFVSRSLSLFQGFSKVPFKNSHIKINYSKLIIPKEEDFKLYQKADNNKHLIILHGWRFWNWKFFKFLPEHFTRYNVHFYTFPLHMHRRNNKSGYSRDSFICADIDTTLKSIELFFRYCVISKRS